MAAQQLSSSPHPSQSSSQPLIGRARLQGVALVMIFGFLVMGILAYRTYSASMPIPDKVVNGSGQTLFPETGELARSASGMPGIPGMPGGQPREPRASSPGTALV